MSTIPATFHYTEKLLVTAVRDVYVGGGPKPQEVDSEGCVVLSRCAPGMHRLVGLADGVMVDRGPPPFVFDQPLRIVPGRNLEVVVHVPKPPDVRGR